MSRARTLIAATLIAIPLLVASSTVNREFSHTNLPTVITVVESLLMLGSIGLLRVKRDVDLFVFRQLMIVGLGAATSIAVANGHAPTALMGYPLLAALGPLLLRRHAHRWIYLSTLGAALGGSGLWIIYGSAVPVDQGSLTAHGVATLVVSAIAAGLGFELDRQRRANEEELKVREERLMLAFESAEMGVVEYNQTQNELAVSPQLVELLGADPDDFADTGWEAFVAMVFRPPERDRVRQALDELSVTGKPQRLELPYDTGRRRGWFEAYVGQQRRQRETLLTVTLRDVTERREDEQRRREFIAMASHELRTPVNGILGMVQLLAATSLDVEQQRWVSRLQNSSYQLAETVRNVLDFSVLDAGAFESKPEEVHIRRFVDQLVVLQGQTPRQVDLAAWVDTRVPELITLDAARVRQVLLNLLNNALKFTDDGTVHLNVETAGTGKLRFTVRDTGIGIPEEAQRDIFRAFRQADGSRTRRHSGQGLGLAISKQIVDQLEGTITFESRERVGSTFVVEVPVTLGRPSSSDALAGHHIAVTERRPATQQVIRDALAEQGATVHLVTSPLDAVRHVPEGVVFSAIVSSDAKPRNHAVLRELDPEGAVPRMVVGSTETESLPATYQAISYPVSQRELQRAAAQAVTRRAAVHVDEAIEDNDTLATQFPLRILVVEDDATNREVNANVLRMLGYDALLVTNGKEAVEHAAAIPLDLILMDIHMPVMDGLEATELIRAMGDIEQPVIMAFTADAATSKIEFEAAGFDAVLSKPLVVQDLVDALQKAFATHLEHSAESAGDPDEVPPMFAQLLKLFDDENELRALISTYLDSGVQALAEIEAGIAAGDAQSVRKSAHRWKSASATIGAEQVHVICARMQHQAEEGALDAVAAELEAVRDAHDAFRTWSDSTISTRGGVQ